MCFFVPICFDQRCNLTFVLFGGHTRLYGTRCARTLSSFWRTTRHSTLGWMLFRRVHTSTLILTPTLILTSLARMHVCARSCVYVCGACAVQGNSGGGGFIGPMFVRLAWHCSGTFCKVGALTQACGLQTPMTPFMCLQGRQQRRQ